jgi:HlyD family secretion protein
VTKAQARTAKADAEAKKAKARLVEAEARLRTHASGLKNGLYSPEQLRTAEFERDSANSDLSIANAEQQASRAEVELAELAVSGGVEKLQWTTIRSPIAGTVVSIGVERGSIVSSGLTSVSGGTPLMTIAQLDTLYVVGELDESQIGKVAVGQLARLSTSAYAGQKFDGAVDRLGVSGRDDDGLVVFDVRIKLADEARSQLRLGMSVEAEIITAEHHGVALIPSGALQRDGDGYYKVSTGDGQARKIEVIADDGTRVAVRGVQPGEHIMLPNDGAAASADPDVHWSVQ